MKIGLVLEGGAMRGMFTAGVLDVFLDNNISVDCVVGVSAGALFGVNLLSKQKGRAIRYNKRFNGDKNYIGIKPFLKEGNLINTQYAFYEVPRRLDIFDDEAYKNSASHFYAVATDVSTGKADYLEVKSVFEQMDILRASGSLPIVSKPVLINGKKYLDGGISDSIPYEWLQNQGCDKIIAILTRDKSFTAKAMPKAIINICKREYPEVARKLSERHIDYNNSIAKLSQLENEKKIFVIRPSESIKVGVVERNPEKLQKIYDSGVENAKKIIKPLKEYLNQF